MICRLQTSGFQLVVRPGNKRLAREGWAEILVELGLNEGLSGTCQVRAASYSPLNDLVRLSDYCTDYVSHAWEEPDGPDCLDTWVPLSLAFRVTLCNGETFDDGDGELGISVAVNVGAGERRVYTGVECSASFREVLQFASDLRAFVTELTP